MGFCCGVYGLAAWVCLWVLFCLQDGVCSWAWVCLGAGVCLWVGFCSWVGIVYGPGFVHGFGTVFGLGFVDGLGFGVGDARLGRIRDIAERDQTVEIARGLLPRVCASAWFMPTFLV